MASTSDARFLAGADRHRAGSHPFARWRAGLARYGTLAASGSLALGALVVLYHVDPNAADSPLPGCPFLALTGLYCPGCGSTRCLHALAHLDLPAALAMNPLLVLSLAPLALLLLHGAGLLPRRLWRLVPVVASPRLWLVLLIGFGVLRNLPWAPFAWLAPG